MAKSTPAPAEEVSRLDLLEAEVAFLRAKAAFYAGEIDHAEEMQAEIEQWKKRFDALLFQKGGAA